LITLTNKKMNYDPSFPVWSNNPYLRWQYTPGFELPKRVEEWLNRLFGTPILPFWMRDEIISTLQDHANKLVNTPLISVTVFISGECYRIIEQREERFVSDRTEALGILSQWLTEQVQASNLSNPNLTQLWPDVFCRVELVGKDAEMQGRFPEKRWVDILKSLEAKGIFKIPADTPPFSISIQTESYTLYPAKIVPLTPTDLEPLSIRSKMIIGVNDFVKNDWELTQRIPLVAQQHIEVATTYAPQGAACLWVKHLGDQETWLPKGKRCVPVPCDAWIQLANQSRLVLGRMIKNNRGDMVIVRGSLLLEVVYEQKNRG